MFNLRLLLVAILIPTSGLRTESAPRPNIVLILADDIGYGDVGCYGATKVRTPHVDRLATEGLRFTDGHAASATCTPSRYALLTGEYAWRKKGTGVLTGDAALIIEPGRATLPALLRQAGYRTAVVGKWHLGLGRGHGTTDWNDEIAPGPREVGFDESFIIPATGDRTPCVYVENGSVVGLDPADPLQVSFSAKVGDDPTARDHPELLTMGLTHGHDQTIVNGISRIGFMSGGRAARWVDEDMADVITRRAVRFIEENRMRPFFLYFATHDIHVPRVPHPRFRGSSDCGRRGDAVHQFDASVGEIVAALDRLTLARNTLVILTSDNGPVLDDGYADGAVADRNGHQPGGPFRGGKYSLFEAGTRVPFVVRWPARVRPGVSAALVSQVDFVSTLAALVNVPVPAETAPDSRNVLAALLGEGRSGRTEFVHAASGLALRQGPWKYIPPGKGPARFAQTDIESGIAAEPQLYYLERDPGETSNLAAREPVRVRRMQEKLHIVRGRPPR